LEPQAERELANILNTMQKWGHGLSRTEVLDMVQVYVQRTKIKTRFKDDRPGEEWFLNFCKRNKLSLKKPQGVELARRKQENPWAIYGFFDLLEKTIEDMNLQNKPELIFNCDETSFSSDPSTTKIIGTIGSTCTRTISSAGRDNTTVLVCCSASGQKLPLLAIFKGKNIIESMMHEKEDPLDITAFATSQKGWMTTVIFTRWFEKVFLPNIPKERPILLVVDGHVSHISCELITKALENEIWILKLPPPSTHILQPLDVGVFKSMKSQWDKALCKWQRANPRRKISKREFVQLLNQEFKQMSPLNILNGFKATGIYNPEVNGPDRQQIPSTTFQKSDLDKYLKQFAGNLDEDVTSNQNVDLVHQTTEQDKHESTNIPSNSPPRSNSNDEPQPGPSSASDSELPPSTSSSLNDFETILMRMLSKEKEKNTLQSPQLKRRRVCNGAEIITTAEFFEKKKQEEEQKKIKEEKKNANISKTIKKGKSLAPKCKTKQKKYENTSDSEESISDAAEMELESEDETIDTVAVVDGDYVLVKYLDELYPGRVLSVKGEKVEISHMEKSGPFAWRWPKKLDILSYDNEIIQIIQEPQAQNKRGCFVVPEMKKYTY
jgi:FKBP-type peptidyl-prolyl cis-trans isomerase